MAMWTQVQKLPEELQKRVHLIYNDHFPYEVRSLLSEWIESQPWTKIEYDNPEHEKFAANLVSALIHELNRISVTIENNSLKFKLEQVAHNFRMNYAHDPINLVRIVNHCLNNESKILQSAQNVSNIFFCIFKTINNLLNYFLISIYHQWIPNQS